MEACFTWSAVRVDSMDDPAMKRFLVLGLFALGLAGIFESTASAENIPPGIGKGCKRVGRVEGYWKNPTRGPLYDYSSYFATLYPYIPGAQEYQWQATVPGRFGTAVAVLPTSPPYPPAGPAKPPVAPARP
jgi:hypothetical protein